MRQGTVSILFGCHSILHSIFVLLAWRKLYNRWPEPWQVICIFLHDIGHWGTNYLDNLDEKKSHWRLGARISLNLFGLKGWKLVAGHCIYSGEPKSELYKPDKYAFLIAPKWWLYTNLIFEPKIKRVGISRWKHLKMFQEEVKKSIETGIFKSNHDIYLEQEKWAKGK